MDVILERLSEYLEATEELRREIRAAMGATLLLFVGPYLAFQHANTGHWAATSKNKDASIDAWRAVAQDNRLERDQILYAIQPDGVSLGRTYMHEFKQIHQASGIDGLIQKLKDKLAQLEADG